MARYIGRVSGQGNEVTRLGSPRSGITTHANGWSLGVLVVGEPVTSVGDLRDHFYVYATSGSGGGFSPRLLGTLTLGDDGKPSFEVAS